MNIEEIEGIGPAFAAKLKAAGVSTVDGLLQQGASSRQRDDLAKLSGLSASQILEWVNRADLMRVNGVGSEYADLLEACGVDSPPELAQRNAVNLTTAMAAANEKKKLVRQLPSESVVNRWIADAKGLKKIVEH